MAVSKGFELASLGSALDTSQTDGEVLSINMDTDVLAEGTTNLYFTNERVDDRVNDLLVAGTSVSLTYNDAAGTLTIALDTTGGLDLSNNDTDDLPEGSTNLYYTDARVDTFLGSGNATSLTTTGDVTIGGNLTINGTTTTINSTALAVDDINITIASGAANAAAADGAGITADLGSDGTATILYDATGDSWVFNKPLYQNTDKVITESVFTGASNYAFKTISDGIHNAVADSTTDTFTIREGDQIEVTVTNDDPTYGDSVLIGHAISGVTAGSYGSATQIPVLTIDAEGHVTTAQTATLTTSWTITDGTTSQVISGGDTLTVIDGTDINAVVGATDQLTINNTSTLQTVTDRGNVTTNSVGIGTNTITSGYKLDVVGLSLFEDQIVVRDAAFGTAYNNLNGLVLDSSQLAGTVANTYGVGVNFTAQGSASKKAGIAPFQNSTDPDDVSLRLFVSASNTATDPVALALELLKGGQVKVSNAYTLPTADGTANQALVTDGAGTVSFGTISSAIDWNVAANYAFKTVSVAGTSLVADSNTDTLTITISEVDSTAGLVVTTDANTDSFTIGHADTSTVNDLTSSANTFVNALTFDTYGHVTGRTTGAIDFNVAANYAYKYMSDGTNIATAASNVDTFTFTNGVDTTAVVNSANDSMTFNNTSTLDSVTGRGNTTTNSITVGDATVNGNLTVNGTLTTLDTQNLVVEDPVIVLNKNQSTPANDVGFIFQRYSSATPTNYNVAMVWNEADDRLSIGKTTENGSDNTITASAEWVSIVNDGDVGIGTTAPDSRLHVYNGAVNGGIRVTSDTGYNSQLLLLEGTSIKHGITYVPSVSKTLYNQNGTDYMAVTNTGLVGIGTTTPYNRLDVNGVGTFSTGVGIGTTNASTMLHLYANNDGGAANNTLRFEDTDAGTAVNQQLGLIEFYGNDSSTGGTGVKAYMGAFAESLTPEVYLAFGTDAITGTASERMRIASTGYVGVGTTNPSVPLHIYNTVARELIENSSTGQASLDLKNTEGMFRIITDNGRLYVYDQTDFVTRFDISTDGNITFNNAFTFPNADGTTNQALITDGSGTLSWGSLSSSIDWNTSGNYAFTTIATPAGTYPVADSNADTLTLANGADISITGDATADSVTIANTSTLQSVTGRGNTTTNSVGIGTTDTGSTLVVANNVDTSTDWYTNSQATVRIKNNHASGAPVLKFEDTLSRIVYGSGGATDKLIMSSRESLNTTAEVITFNNDGEVGIGTVDPVARLHIGPFNGSSTSPHLLLTSSNNAYGWRFDTNDYGTGDVPLRIFSRTNNVDAERVRINQSGNVGIGVTTAISHTLVLPNAGAIGFHDTSSTSRNVLSLDGSNDIIYGGAGAGINNHIWKRAGVEQLRLDTSGRLLLNKAATSAANASVEMVAINDTSFEANFYASTADVTAARNVQIGSGNNLGQIWARNQEFSVGTRHAHSLLFTTNNTVKGVITSDGNLGIGTTAPAFTSGTGVEIQRSGTATLRLDSQTFATELRGKTDGTEIYQLSAGYLDLGTSSTTRLRITGGGDIGVGTTNPTAKLDVRGTVSYHAYTLPNSGGSTQWVKLGTISSFTQGGSTIRIRIAGHSGYNAINSQDYAIELFMKTSNSSSVNANGAAFNSWWYQYGNNAALPTFKWVANAAGGAATAYDLYMNVPQFSSDSHYMVEKTEGVWTVDGTVGVTDPGADSSTVLEAAAMYNILNTNVGIGTVSASERLHVNGKALITNGGSLYIDSTSTGGVLSATGARVLDFETDSTKRMTIGSTGNVGIATTNPAAPLDVYGNTQVNSGRLYVGQTAGQYVSMGRDTGGNAFIDAIGDDVPFRIYTKQTGQSNSAKLSVLGNGNVGIGTTNPQETLHVNGSVRIDSTYNLDSATATLATTTQTSILAISATTFGSAKYLIQAYDSVSGERQVSELLVLSDGTTATSTEYAILFTGSSPIASFDTDISGGNIRLLATSASTNSTQYKVKLTAILA